MEQEELIPVNEFCLHYNVEFTFVHSLHEHGLIEISFNKNQLTIRNTGVILNSKPEELFERFKKDKPESESLGLGLSIVKKICEQYHFKISYSYTDGFHTTGILFS